MTVATTSCVIGGVIITTGEEAADELERVFHAGLDRAGGTLVINGSIVATASGDPLKLDEIVVTLGTIGKPAPVLLDSASEGERLVVGFQGRTAFDNDVPYIADEIIGDGDGHLETNETAELRLSVADIGDGTLAVGPAEEWTLLISAPTGGTIEVSRTTPFALQPVNTLR